jgi:hypothetical protein
MTVFQRGLKPDALAALWIMTRSPDSNWWQDLLSLWSPSGTVAGARPLRLAIRDNYLNFYLRGQSVARVVFDHPNPFVEVHLKYAFDNVEMEEQEYAELRGTELRHARTGRSCVYDGLRTLRSWMARAANWETAEKAQVERVVADNPNVIDLEMGIPAHAGQVNQRRIDLVALEPKNTGCRIVFWEAKLVTDGRLKSNSPRPGVMTQIDDYRSYFSDCVHRKTVVNAYRDACRTLTFFAEMAAHKGKTKLRLGPLVLKAAEMSSVLTVDREPRLVIFGTNDQFASPRWLMHEDKLRDLQVRLLRVRSDGYALTCPTECRDAV